MNLDNNNAVALELLYPDADFNPYAPFLGIAIGKKAIARKKERIQDRRQATLDRIGARNAPKLELASQGIVAPSGIQTALSSVGSLVSSLKGTSPVLDVLNPQPPAIDNSVIGNAMDNTKQVVNTPGNSNSQNDKQSFTKSKNFPYIISGAVLFVVVLLVLILTIKKK
jgi:hypothetical protein